MVEFMEKWQLETAERLASIERSIKYIEHNLTNLPPSSTCLTNHVKMENRIEALEDFKKYIIIRISWISGAFAVIASGFVSAFDSARDFLFKVH
jgi:hypothetical protein